MSIAIRSSSAITVSGHSVENSAWAIYNQIQDLRKFSGPQSSEIRQVLSLREPRYRLCLGQALFEKYLDCVEGTLLYPSNIREVIIFEYRLYKIADKRLEITTHSGNAPAGELSAVSQIIDGLAVNPAK